MSSGRRCRWRGSRLRSSSGWNGSPAARPRCVAALHRDHAERRQLLDLGRFPGGQSRSATSRKRRSSSTLTASASIRSVLASAMPTDRPPVASDLNRLRPDQGPPPKRGGRACHGDRATSSRPASATVAQGGFTLVEVIVVLSVVLLLTGIAVPMLSSYMEDGRRARARERVQGHRAAMMSFYKDVGSYPDPQQLGHQQHDLLAVHRARRCRPQPWSAGHNWITWGMSATRGDLLDNHLLNTPQGQSAGPTRRPAPRKWRGPYLAGSDAARPLGAALRDQRDRELQHARDQLQAPLGAVGGPQRPLRHQRRAPRRPTSPATTSA
jgi:prepilin-type N-terminal cleavage/methylation domain-containing protein